jgi:hypothetical protein
MVAEDLNSSQLCFFDIMDKYFNRFAGPFFDEDPTFWKAFVNTISFLFGCPRETVSRAVDALACEFLYAFRNQPANGLFVALNRFGMSERAAMEMGSQNVAKLDKAAAATTIAVKNGRPCCETAVADGGFICEVPGKLYDYDEMPSLDGLSLSWISVPETDFVIDTDETGFTVCSSIRRSFHYNCEPKLVRIQQDVKVGLIAHRMRGPLIEQIAKRGPAIPEGGEIILPLDADMPFPIPPCAWKDRGTKFRPAPLPEAKAEEPASRHLLLDLFSDLAPPPLPVKVLSNEEINEKEKAEAIKTSTRILTRQRLKRTGEDKQ